MVYGGLFLAAGVLLLGVTYTLVSTQKPGPVTNNVLVGQDETRSGDIFGTQQQGSDVWSQALDALQTQGSIALAVVTVGTVGFGWLLAGRLLQPLQPVTETAQRIAEAPAADRGLHERIGLTGPPDEIKKLADTFDVMIARLDHAFDGQRSFVANASHELRTPLTVNRALLELALHRESPTPELRQLGETLLEMNTRQERLLDALLLLARAEHEVTGRAYVDLADIAEHVAASAPNAKLDLDEAPTDGNPALLERLVQNLVNNAVRHGAGELWVTTGVQDGVAVLRIANTGAVIRPYEVAALFEPFHRLAANRTADTGLGLGLSIVRAVARAHGGQATAESRPDGGLIITVTLPLAQPHPELAAP